MIKDAEDGVQTVPICWLSTKNSEVLLKPAKSLGENGHCLSTFGACRAGRTIGIMPSLQCWAMLRSQSRLSYGTTRQLCLREIVAGMDLYCLLWLTPFACILSPFPTPTVCISWTSSKMCLFVLFVCLCFSWFPWFKPNKWSGWKMMLRIWLLIEELIEDLIDSFGITCSIQAYHRFSHKLKREAILLSSQRYVRILLGLPVRIFSMSILLYNKFSLETPFLLLTALTWLLISAQAVSPPAISFPISL